MTADERNEADAAVRASPAGSPPAGTVTPEEQERIYQAGFDAAMVWQLGLWLPAAVVVTFLPLVGIVGLVGYFLLLVAVPGMALRWRLKYGRLSPRDPDILDARDKVLRATVLWAIFGVLTVFFVIVYVGLLLHSYPPGGPASGHGMD